MIWLGLRSTVTRLSARSFPKTLKLPIIETLSSPIPNSNFLDKRRLRAAALVNSTLTCREQSPSSSNLTQSCLDWEENWRLSGQAMSNCSKQVIVSSRNCMPFKTMPTSLLSRTMTYRRSLMSLCSQMTLLRPVWIESSVFTP